MTSLFLDFYVDGSYQAYAVHWYKIILTAVAMLKSLYGKQTQRLFSLFKIINVHCAEQYCMKWNQVTQNAFE